jgi:hypothetical protein
MSAGFFVWYYLKSRAVRVSTARIAAAQTGYQNNHANVAILLAECREYAKTNADLARLLEGPVSAPQAAPAPASKPHAK